MGIFRYYLKIFREAVAIVSKFLGLGSKVAFFRTILLWACTTLFIYFIASENLIQSRFELGVSSILALVVVASITFIISLFIAPVNIHKSLDAEKSKLQSVIDSAVDSESRLRELSKLYYEGKSMYDKGFQNEDEQFTWERSLEEWKNTVENRLEEGFSISELHKFGRPQGFSYFQIRTVPENLIEEHREVLEKFTANLSNLNDIVEDNACNIEASIKFSYENWEQET